jgi:hypothetical protein
MSVPRSHAYLTIWLLFAVGCAARAQEFPEWQGGGVSVDIEWERATIVAVGNVDNVTFYGEQKVNGLPWPGSVGVEKLYWCQGDFHVTALLKGSLTKVEKYLWPLPRPGCELYSHNPKMIASRYKTRVWFLREEGGLLRPLYDGGGARAFIGFCAAWAAGDPLPPRRRVGVLLLTPSADCVTAPGEMRDYINYLWQVGDLACRLLGKEECIRRMRSPRGFAERRTAEGRMRVPGKGTGDELPVLHPAASRPSPTTTARPTTASAPTPLATWWRRYSPKGWTGAFPASLLPLRLGCSHLSYRSASLVPQSSVRPSSGRD